MVISRTLIAVPLALVAGLTTLLAQQPQQQPPGRDSFRFRTGVELINVTATVTDASGRFVSGLRKEDFRVLEDNKPQEITHFSAERVPVSLGIVLDTSSSMEGEKMLAARRALEHFLLDLLGPDDEVFLYRFADNPELVQGWTRDRQLVVNELRRLKASGATSLYDAVAEALPLVQSGRHRKKALVIISDGNDTNSKTDIVSLKALIRDTEALVYAIGVDVQYDTSPAYRRPFEAIIPWLQRKPIPFPFPFPKGRPPRGPDPNPPPPRSPPPRFPNPPASPGTGGSGTGSDRVDVVALRDITDDSGGRTEVLRSARDLGPATSGIADELSKQYYIGYPGAAPRDGHWHSIRVEVRDGAYRVRARRGYVATP